MAAVRTVPTTESLPPEDVDSVWALINLAEDHDGFSALNEAASLRLRHVDHETAHFLINDEEGVIGYGQLHGPAVAQSALVVDAAYRRRGLGTALLQRMLEISDGGLEVWATRNTVAARGLAARVGLIAVRQLFIMTRPLAEPIDAAEPPPGVRIRPFVPRHDEDAWLAVNAAAFATHPEQGGLTRADLAQRMAESWFDPAGFLVAERAGELIGFHWTKQHPGQLGEVYVLGVDPTARVRGLGRALLTVGLEHLRQAGNTEVELYVDAENARAVALYEKSGFSVATSDVLYASPNSGRHPLATMHLSSDPTERKSQENP
ncbi:MAG TPA: mycothiol synthase [Microlunatus sp.]